MTVWIGYIQWLRDNGFGSPASPILKPLDSILQMDAILAYDAAGPAGGAGVARGRRDHRQSAVPGGQATAGRAWATSTWTTCLPCTTAGCPGEADLVCYWFEKARALIEAGKVGRAGLLATQAIRGGANRKVLERIKADRRHLLGGVRPGWILDGAAVHVSMVGFDDGTRAGPHPGWQCCQRRSTPT